MANKSNSQSICKCGHKKEKHFKGLCGYVGQCYFLNSTTTLSCPCPKFVEPTHFGDSGSYKVEDSKVKDRMYSLEDGDLEKAARGFAEAFTPSTSQPKECEWHQYFMGTGKCLTCKKPMPTPLSNQEKDLQICPECKVEMGLHFTSCSRIKWEDKFNILFSPTTVNNGWVGEVKTLDVYQEKAIKSFIREQLELQKKALIEKEYKDKICPLGDSCKDCRDAKRFFKM